MARPRVTEGDVVLDAAARRLTKSGIAGTTVDDVAGEAGVSRATVYRYVGGKDEIVRAVIGRETTTVLDRLRRVIEGSERATVAIADVVTTALVAIGESPVLARLSTTDLRDTLPFVTVDAASLVGAVVETLAPALRSAPFPVEDRHLEDAIEELTRFVLAELTTPRRNDSRLDPAAAGRRATVLIAPLIETEEGAT